MLQKSVPKYNGETGESVLYVEFQDFLGQTYVDNPEAVKELQDIIAAQTGKSVEIQMLVANKHQHTNLAQVSCRSGNSREYPYGYSYRRGS